MYQLPIGSEIGILTIFRKKEVKNLYRVSKYSFQKPFLGVHKILDTRSSIEPEYSDSVSSIEYWQNRVSYSEVGE